MQTVEPIVESSDIAHAWARAFSLVSSRPGREASPLVVTVSTEDGIREDPVIRRIVDSHLAAHSQSSVRTVASTIFPASLWRRDQSSDALFARYERLWPRIKKGAANRNGTYFQRFSAFESPVGPINQLKHVVSTWKKGNHRRSALQIAVFDPTKDHTDQRQRGFPCLQQVAVVPGGDRLGLTGFYAMQLVLEKAYGNYVGLVRLGEFLAHEMQLTLSRVTCVASVAKLSQVKEFKKPQREAIQRELEVALGSETA